MGYATSCVPSSSRRRESRESSDVDNLGRPDYRLCGSRGEMGGESGSTRHVDRSTLSAGFARDDTLVTRRCLSHNEASIVDVAHAR